MNEEKNSKFKGKLPELLASNLPLNPNNNSFKKIKSNSINVIDFESTLSLKNKTICVQDSNHLLFKRKELIRQKPENISNEIKQEKMNNSLYKYLEANTNNNNFNSAHYSNVETNSIKTKETNGASTNHETNRHSFSMIFNLKNTSSPHQIKDQTQPYNIQQINGKHDSKNDLKKKISSNSIGNFSIEHILNSKQIHQPNIKPPIQTNKYLNKTENITKNNVEKPKHFDKNKKTQILAASLSNDFKQVFEFRLFFLAF